MVPWHHEHGLVPLDYPGAGGACQLEKIIIGRQAQLETRRSDAQIEERPGMSGHADSVAAGAWGGRAGGHVTSRRSRRAPSSRRAPRELAPRAERRRAARERHRQGGPLWTDRDRHLDHSGGPPISETADTGGIGKPIIELPRMADLVRLDVHQTKSDPRPHQDRPRMAAPLRASP